MMTLEKRYVRSQNELSSSNEDSERLRTELLGLQTMLEQVCECFVYFNFFCYYSLFCLFFLSSWQCPSAVKKISIQINWG